MKLTAERCFALRPATARSMLTDRPPIRKISPMFESDEPDYLFTVETPGERLDKLLAETLPDLSRTRLQALIKEGRVLVNGATSKVSFKLVGEEEIAIYLPPPVVSAVLPEDIPLDVLYEDDDLIAINKPAGMVVHPALGHESGTLVNAVLYRWPALAQVGDEARAGIVHRLDKDTSGVIVVTKTPQAHRDIAAQFEARETEKHYLALVEGNPSSTTGRIEAPIGRDPQQRKRMAVVRDGRDAITEFKVLEYYAEQALLDVRIYTGRTHQIRVHLAFIGHPVVGDSVYGFHKQRIKLKRCFLHSHSLALRSPSNGQMLTFTAPLPAGLQNILDKLPR